MDGMGGVGVGAIGLILLLCGCGMVGGMVGLEEDHAGCRGHLKQMMSATSCWPLQLQPGVGRHARRLQLIQAEDPDELEDGVDVDEIVLPRDISPTTTKHDADDIEI